MRAGQPAQLYLIVVIATSVQFPGFGCPEITQRGWDALGTPLNPETLVVSGGLSNDIALSLQCFLSSFPSFLSE